MSLGFVYLTKANDPVGIVPRWSLSYEVTHKLADIILICVLEPRAEVEVFQRSLKSRLESGGCVLSPMLFNCYVQSISEWLSKMANSKSQMVNGKGDDLQQMVVCTVINSHPAADLCAGFQFAP